MDVDNSIIDNSTGICKTSVDHLTFTLRLEGSCDNLSKSGGTIQYGFGLVGIKLPTFINTVKGYPETALLLSDTVQRISTFGSNFNLDIYDYSANTYMDKCYILKATPKDTSVIVGHLKTLGTDKTSILLVSGRDCYRWDINYSSNKITTRNLKTILESVFEKGDLDTETVITGYPLESLNNPDILPAKFILGNTTEIYTSSQRVYPYVVCSKYDNGKFYMIDIDGTSYFYSTEFGLLASVVSRDSKYYLDMISSYIGNIEQHIEPDLNPLSRDYPDVTFYISKDSYVFNKIRDGVPEVTKSPSSYTSVRRENEFVDSDILERYLKAHWKSYIHNTANKSGTTTPYFCYPDIFAYGVKVQGDIYPLDTETGLCLTYDDDVKNKYSIYHIDYNTDKVELLDTFILDKNDTITSEITSVVKWDGLRHLSDMLPTDIDLSGFDIESINNLITNTPETTVNTINLDIIEDDVEPELIKSLFGGLQSLFDSWSGNSYYWGNEANTFKYFNNLSSFVKQVSGKDDKDVLYINTYGDIIAVINLSECYFLLSPKHFATVNGKYKLLSTKMFIKFDTDQDAIYTEICAPTKWRDIVYKTVLDEESSSLKTSVVKYINTWESNPQTIGVCVDYEKGLKYSSGLLYPLENTLNYYYQLKYTSGYNASIFEKFCNIFNFAEGYITAGTSPTEILKFDQNVLSDPDRGLWIKDISYGDVGTVIEIGTQKDIINTESYLKLDIASIIVLSTCVLKEFGTNKYICYPFPESISERYENLFRNITLIRQEFKGLSTDNPLADVSTLMNNQVYIADSFDRDTVLNNLFYIVKPLLENNLNIVETANVFSTYLDDSKVSTQQIAKSDINNDLVCDIEDVAECLRILRNKN